MWSNLNSRTIFWNLKIDNFFSGSYVLPKFIILSVSVFAHAYTSQENLSNFSFQVLSNKQQQKNAIRTNLFEQTRTISAKISKA